MQSVGGNEREETLKRKSASKKTNKVLAAQEKAEGESGVEGSRGERKDGSTVIGTAFIQFEARTVALLESQAVVLLLVSSLYLYWKGGRFFRFRLISHWREEHRRPYERLKNTIAYDVTAVRPNQVRRNEIVVDPLRVVEFGRSEVVVSVLEIEKRCF
ncbi:hypothetical protein B296_00024949 [Ensete ventricosum]|uniref:Uncharacterized protein n=1 Tax=Ensete ventricosum TaxID=4639 RepID=A0A427ADY7_ENSVE|nr:hypothetical protein B296_00024949 [Ensete ventricosum]